jgi:hypothetical protein
MAEIDGGSACALAELAVAFPQQVRGYSYSIERSSDRRSVGCLEGGQGRLGDPVREYCAILLSDGTTIELAELSETPGTVSMWHDGRPFGRCVSAGEGKPLRPASAKAWDLYLEERPFGKIERGLVVTHGSLFIQRPDGRRLPLVLARSRSHVDMVRCLWSLVSLRLLWGRPWPNRDLVLPDGSIEGLSEAEVLYYFAISLFFRAWAFGFEFGDGGD